MNPRLLPTTPREKLEHLIEECSEVILAAQKLKRFGAGPHTFEGVDYPCNAETLHKETIDLAEALTKVWNCFGELRKP